MVPIVVSLNLALFFAQLAAAAPISTEFQCTSDGIHGNPENCLKFIICAHGQRQDFDCPQGTSWHADRGICDTTDLSKCTADPTATSSGNSEDVFKQHLLSLLADFKPCHAGETTPNPGQGGNGTTPGNGGPGETTPGNSGGNPTTPGNPGNNGGSSTGNPGGNSSPNPDGGNTGTTPENGGGSSPGNPGGNGTTPGGPTTAGPGETTPGNSGGNPTTPGNNGGSSTGNPGQGGNGSTPQPTSLPPPTCPACPIPTEKPCPAAPQCAACPDPVPQSCPAAPTCPPPAPAPTCKACPAPVSCPATPTCPPHPTCPACPKPTEKVCPTVAPCPTTTPTPKKPVCDAGWKYNAATKSCYFLGVEKLTGSAAQAKCFKQGATLASVHSADENKFIYDLIKSYGNKDAFFNCWLGGYRTGSGPTNFANYDGTPFDFKNFLEGDPNNLGNNEYCVEMQTNFDGRDQKWNDAVCGNPIPAYMCKKAANT